MSAKLVSDADLRKAVEKIVAAYKQQAESLKNPNPMLSEPAVPRVLVAIAGRPGGGKSTIASILAAAVREALRDCPDPMAPFRKTDINDAERNASEDDAHNGGREGKGRDAQGVEVCVMPMDGYHLYRKELAELPDPQEAVRRRGAEWTFSPVRLRRDLKALKRHNERHLFDDVLVPSFDHGAGDPVERDIRIPGSAGVIIVEGNYLLYRGTPEWMSVNDLFDVTIFLSCDRAVCIERLASRHMRAWKIPRAQAMVRAQGSDTVNGDLVDTTAKNADVVIHSINNPQASL